jgi:hypothetical protein
MPWLAHIPWGGGSASATSRLPDLTRADPSPPAARALFAYFAPGDSFLDQEPFRAVYLAPPPGERQARRWYTRGVVSELVSTLWWERYPEPLPEAATLRFATALVKDGMTGVTLVVPRAPGVLARARLAALVAGVEVSARDVGSATITLRFSAGFEAVPSDRATDGPVVAPPHAAGRRWAWLPRWVRPRAAGVQPQPP